MDPLDPRHGTNAGHVAGCRDDCCRMAHNAYRRSVWRKRYARKVDRLMVDSTGSQRRLRGLQALGWRLDDIASEIGVGVRGSSDARWIKKSLYSLGPTIHVDSAAAIATAYDRLSMRAGPSSLLRAKASNWGWPQPIAWDDGTIDDPRAFPRWDWIVCSTPECNEAVEARSLCVTHYRALVRPTLPSRTRSTEERLAAYLDRTPQGCWVWKGARNQYGYGSMRGPSGTVATHRFVYEREVGPIPDGLELDHLCRVRGCCNPEHLEPVTRQQNVDRGDKAAGNLCHKGHPFDFVTSKGERRCSVCERAKRESRTREAFVTRWTSDWAVVARILNGDFALAEKASVGDRWEVVQRWSRSDAELERETGWNVARIRSDARQAEAKLAEYGRAQRGAA